MPILRKLLDLLLPGFNPAKIKRNEEDLQAQPNPLRLANYFALRTIFAFAARYPTYESQGFEIKLRTEWVGSRRLWETLRFTRFRLSLSESDDTLTLEGRAEYHFLHLKDSSMPETYADRKEWFDVRTVLSRSGSIRPELPASVDWSVVFEQLPKYLPS